MICIEIENLCKTFHHEGNALPVLQDLSLSILQDSFTVIVGHSGCGKTTLLRIIAGLEHPTSGSILQHPPGGKVGFVFQEPRLMPWLSVRKNMTFLAPNIAEKELNKLLDLLDLGEYADFYPQQISGGRHKKSPWDVPFAMKAKLS